jgi:hypothetical protein
MSHLTPQITKRQPDDDVEQLVDDTLDTAGSDETVESSGLKQWWSVSHFLLL